MLPALITIIDTIISTYYQLNHLYYLFFKVRCSAVPNFVLLLSES